MPARAVLLVLVALCTPLALVSSQITYVDGSASGANNGSSWTDAHVDLHDGLAAATSGQLWVADGIYTPAPAGGSELVSFQLTDGVGVYGGFAGGETSLSQRDWEANPTVLSGDIGQDDVYGLGVWYSGWNITTGNSDRIVEASGTGAGTVFDGFIVRAAHGANTPGGGMAVIGGNPTIRHCTFTRNLVAWSTGAGLWVQNADPLIEECSFHENYGSKSSGGGLSVAGAAAPTVRNNSFTSNLSVGFSPQGKGGGLDNTSTQHWTVEDCQFIANTARNQTTSGSAIMAYGGGVHHQGTELTLLRCEFTDNFSLAGGGVFSWSTMTIADCEFSHYFAVSYDAPLGSIGDYGGAFGGLSYSPRTTTIVGSTFAGNSAGEGCGISVLQSHHVVIRNSILWGNEATGNEATGNEATGNETRVIDGQVNGSADIEWSCVEGLLAPIPGEDPPNPGDFSGSHDNDPLYVDEAAGDLRLMAGSPCIDAANNGFLLAASTVDLSGNPRLSDDPTTPDTGVGSAPVVDMGAYEFGSEPSSPWSEVGLGLAGLSGVPTLSGIGNLAGGDPVSLQLAGGLPSGLSSCYQVWIADPGGPVGYAATNGLLAITP
ncbi:MAG: hypothetical protein ACI9EF_003526 [Pseudohongiellaceae bacterium]|jgi:hypothetical protein